MANIKTFEDFSKKKELYNILYDNIPYEWVHQPKIVDYLRICEKYNDIDFIKEGLIKTYPAEIVANHISKLVGAPVGERTSEDYISVDFDDDCIYVIKNVHHGMITDYIGISIMLWSKLSDEKKEKVRKIIDKCGYYLGVTTSSILQFEPKFDKKLTKYEVKKLGKVYHLAPCAYDSKIDKNGLIPKSKNDFFNYPDRVYMFQEPSEEFLNSNGMSIYDYFYDFCVMLLRAKVYRGNKDFDELKKKNLTTYRLYEVDLENANCEFVVDPNLPDRYWGYYTTDNIPASTLSIICTYELDETDI